MNAPNPIFDDWSEYEFSAKRKSGFAARIQVAMWASLLIAFALACGLTILILLLQ